MRHLRFGIFCLAALAPVVAQDIQWDASGNGQLQGNHYFRHVYWGATGARGDTARRTVLYGTINFDGRGAYTLTGSRFDSTEPRVDAVSFTGTYTISAGGQGFLSNPMTGTSLIHGMTARGMFVGSSTEAGSNDLFIAVRAGATPAVNANFTGSYWIASMEFPSSDVALARDALYQLTPNGQGGIGTVNLAGNVGGNATEVRQTVNGASYSFANGVGSLVFGGALGAQNLVAGSKLLYISEDRNLVFGGSADGWDLFVGVRAVTGASPANLRDGFYYAAGAREDLRRLAGGIGDLETYYGAFSSRAGTVVAHRRLYSQLVGAEDFTYTRTDALTATATVETDTFSYVVGSGGLVQIGSGKGSVLGIDVAIKTPGNTGSGVFLDPAGVVNAASSSPFTAGISRGGLITLYGSNLAATTAVDGKFPTTLADVQVFISGRLAPLYVVSSGQVSAIVPFATPGDVASIRLVNKGASSNTVTVRLRGTTPGVFTVPPGGVGLAAALHPDYSLVTRENPARPGEIIQLYIAGLGAVDPPVSDGAPGPGAEPLSRTANKIAVFLDGIEAPIFYVGLPPGLAALYQINFQVPMEAARGDLYMDVAGPDSYASQALLPVAPR